MVSRYTLTCVSDGCVARPPPGPVVGRAMHDRPDYARNEPRLLPRLVVNPTESDAVSVRGGVPDPQLLARVDGAMR